MHKSNFTLILCFLGWALVLPVQLVLAENADKKVWVTLEKPESDTYRIQGVIKDMPDSAIVWECLTDYTGMPKWVSGMDKSTLLKRDGTEIRLAQEVQGEAWIFKKTMHLELQITEIPPEEIHFEDKARQDFERYSGSWCLKLTSTGVDVYYDLTLKTRFFAPRFFAKSTYLHNSEKLLHEVRQEILRRAESRARDQ